MTPSSKVSGTSLRMLDHIMYVCCMHIFVVIPRMVCVYFI
jgi:hypothetical protein